MRRLKYRYEYTCSCRERKVEARSVLLASVWAYPCNWSAWKVGLCTCRGIISAMFHIILCRITERCGHVHR